MDHSAPELRALILARLDPVTCKAIALDLTAAFRPIRRRTFSSIQRLDMPESQAISRQPRVTGCNQTIPALQPKGRQSVTLPANAEPTAQRRRQAMGYP